MTRHRFLLWTTSERRSPPLADVPIRSTSDLTGRWATLLDPPIFSARSLWLLWLGADCRVLPIVVPVDDLPSVPEPAMTAGRHVFSELVSPPSQIWPD